MDYAETVSKRVLEAILPGATLEYRPVQSNGEYDFDLRYSDGTRAAVEVTSAFDKSLAETVDAILSRKKGGSLIQARICRKSWIIFPAKDARINRIRTNADGYLSKLEREGIDRFSSICGGPQCVQEICDDLRVTSDGVIPTEGEPLIRIACPTTAAWVGASNAIQAGEIEAWKLDNRKKLGTVGMTERHLAIYVDLLNGAPRIALISFMPPPSLPYIPPEVTHIWLICQGENANQFVVWYASKDEIWRSTKVLYSTGA